MCTVGTSAQLLHISVGLQFIPLCCSKMAKEMSKILLICTYACVTCAHETLASCLQLVEEGMYLHVHGYYCDRTVGSNFRPVRLGGVVKGCGIGRCDAVEYRPGPNRNP